MKAFKGSADAVVIGSRLARIMEEYAARPQLLPGEMEKFMRGLKQAGQ